MLYEYSRCSTDNIKQDISRKTTELKALGVYLEYASGMVN
jgi:hypothetical protein